MRHDDTDGFLGTTIINHGADPAPDASDKPGPTRPPTDDSPPASHQSEPAPTPPSDKISAQTQKNEREIEALQQQIAFLEQVIQKYQAYTDERLEHLERLAGHPVSDAEKLYRIQEQA